MDALAIFASDNAHPLSFLLSRQHRHVWSAIRVGDYWHVYDWRQGLPVIEVASADFNLAAHYREIGCKVIELERGTEPAHGPVLLNNCVGHTLVMLGIRKHLIFTPHQLWNQLTGNTMLDRIRKLFVQLSFAPGFGGSSPAPPPPPPTPPPDPPKKTDVDVQQARADEIKRSKLAAGQGGTNKTGGVLLEEASTSNRSLLG